MTKLELKCLELYEQGGQHSVYAYIMENRKDIVWDECIPCEAWSPISNNACLVCGTELTPARRASRRTRKDYERKVQESKRLILENLKRKREKKA